MKDDGRILEYTNIGAPTSHTLTLERDSDRLILTGQKFTLSLKYLVAFLLIGLIILGLLAERFGDIQKLIKQPQKLQDAGYRESIMLFAIYMIALAGLVAWAWLMYRRQGCYSHIIIENGVLTSCNPERLLMIRRWAIQKRWRFMIRGRGVSIPIGWIATLTLRSSWGETILFAHIPRAEAFQLQRELALYVEALRDGARPS